MEDLKINYNVDTRAMARKLYELTKDMDYSDYKENELKEIKDIEYVIYYIKATAQNQYNIDSWRTFWNALTILLNKE